MYSKINSSIINSLKSSNRKTLIKGIVGITGFTGIIGINQFSKITNNNETNKFTKLFIKNNDTVDWNNYLPRQNVYHLDEWLCFKDFMTACKTQDITKIKNFHDVVIPNFLKLLKEKSVDKNFNILTFYDNAWYQNITINYDVYEKFMNRAFAMYIYDCKNNVSEEIINWFFSLKIINKKNYYTVFLQTCTTGQLEKAKLLYKFNKIDFNYYSNTLDTDIIEYCLCDKNLEVVKWLAEISGCCYAYHTYLELAKTRINCEKTIKWLESEVNK